MKCLYFIEQDLHYRDDLTQGLESKGFALYDYENPLQIRDFLADSSSFVLLLSIGWNKSVLMEMEGIPWLRREEERVIKMDFSGPKTDRHAHGSYAGPASTSIMPEERGEPVTVVLKQVVEMFVRNFPSDLAMNSGVLLKLFGSNHSLRRTITFRPEHKLAGVQILSYFQNILEQKYPTLDATVRISQEGETVTLEVETSTGTTELIEAELKDYGLVVTGEKAVNSYLENAIHVAQLQTKLELAATEIRSMERMMKLQKTTIKQLWKQIELSQTNHNNVTNRLIGLIKHQEDLHSILFELEQMLKSHGHKSLREELQKVKDSNPDLWSWIKVKIGELSDKALTSAASDIIRSLS